MAIANYKKTLINKDNLRIPYGLAVHGMEEEKRVLKVLREHRTIMGREVKEFEDATKKFFGKKFGVMVNSGSSANLLAMELLNAPVGSEIITPVLTFATTVTPIVQKQLIPVFTDVTEGSYTINVNQIEQLITKKTVALVIPLLLGNVPDLNKIVEIARRHKVVVIQDSCDTFGATFTKKPTGEFADIVTTSFYGSHIITAGGNGGMICTNDKKSYERLLMLRGWGRGSSIIQESEDISLRYKGKLNGKSYDAKFIFGELGYNFLPSEIGAAFGNVQLQKLSRFKKTREKNFKMLFTFFEKYSQFFVLPTQMPEVTTQWLAFPLTIKDNAPFSRASIVKFLEKNNIQTRPIFTGNILQQPAFKHIKSRGIENYPIADKVMSNGFLVGCHHGLDEVHINKIKRVVEEFLNTF